MHEEGRKREGKRKLIQRRNSADSALVARVFAENTRARRFDSNVDRGWKIICICIFRIQRAVCRPLPLPRPPPRPLDAHIEPTSNPGAQRALSKPRPHTHTFRVSFRIFARVSGSEAVLWTVRPSQSFPVKLLEAAVWKSLRSNLL